MKRADVVQVINSLADVTSIAVLNALAGVSSIAVLNALADVSSIAVLNALAGVSSIAVNDDDDEERPLLPVRRGAEEVTEK